MPCRHGLPFRNIRSVRSFLSALLCSAGLLAVPAGVHADDDHNRARQALEAGEILPLSTILDRVERHYPGQVVDVELERGHEARWIYKVKVLQRGGALVRLQVDARDGRILGSRTQQREKD
ncbi:MAG: PepSY domain-containing protein [Rhodocyclaceae bacterium]|nr:PepSY domain-containing protein [Rhodocyclaceae bacterium]